jgi:Acyltransferase
MENATIDIFNYDSIRPYSDRELQEAVVRILQEPLFYKMIRWVYPGLSKTAIQSMLTNVKSVNEFQSEVSGPAFKRVIEMTTSGMSFTNIQSLDRSKAYLFLSNHRDIILDSALLNVSLLEEGYRTTQIAIGDNLLSHKVVEDIVRSNKNFIVNRNVSSKEVYHYSMRLSNYIRKTLSEDGDSIWIAQREGRSKDGDDRTATGLLKMFAMSGGNEIENALKPLAMIPMAVSYEYDPCDILKTNELMHIKQLGHYEKKKGEDVLSMLTGITGHKGRVDISVGSSLDGIIDQMRSIQNKNEKYRFLTQEIDREMHRIYKLWPTNYIAYDLLMGTRDYKEHYSNIQKIAFGNYVRANVFKLSLNRKKTVLPKEGFTAMAREIMLQMYANPVINRQEIEKPTTV